MMGNKNFKVVLSLIVLSLATFALLGGFNLVKPAFAQPQETRKVQQWEYCYMSVPQPGKDGSYVTISRGDHQEALDSDTTGAKALNKLGADGWELVGVSNEVTNNHTYTRFFLKRPR
jgi:hypothetical protein